MLDILSLAVKFNRPLVVTAIGASRACNDGASATHEKRMLILGRAQALARQSHRGRMRWALMDLESVEDLYASSIRSGRFECLP